MDRIGSSTYVNELFLRLQDRRGCYKVYQLMEALNGMCLRWHGTDPYCDCVLADGYGIRYYLKSVIFSYTVHKDRFSESM